MRVCIYIICMSMAACYPKRPRVHHFRGIAMQMPYHVQIGESISLQQQIQISAIIESELAFIHMCFDHWNPKSELSLLNQLPIYETKKLSPTLLELFAIANHIVQISDRHFNPTLGNIISLWKSGLPKAERIDPMYLESMRDSLQWDHISIRNGLFHKSADIQLDFDGIAKGFGIDLLLKRLQFAGYTNIYVDWAGDIAVSGNHPSGRRWQVAIRDPISHLPDAEIIPLQNSAIATSGDYEQSWKIDDKQYSHIIDSHTLQPIEIREGSIASVTVVAPTCAIADGLATSAMTFSDMETLIQWARKVQAENSDISFWIVSRNSFDTSSNPIRTSKYKI